MKMNLNRKKYIKNYKWKLILVSSFVFIPNIEFNNKIKEEKKMEKFTKIVYDQN